ncbi:transporter substrate-binding domain-containing protein [Paracoccus aestuariivivens]|uniref:transporter substrate-binding domain-containing protein n=1 Tax=Paracoccus aestuariivivens TaxID=1820333 RepID=UPI001479254B
MLGRGIVVLALTAPHVSAAEALLPICYREDTAPFSYLDAKGEPAGYTIELCRRVAASLNVEVKMVAVTAEDRFARLARGDCDLLCEATSVTLKRRQQADFSYYTFLTGAAFLYPKKIEDAGKSVIVGYLKGTTVETAARAGNIIGGNSGQFILKEFEFESHEEAQEALANGEVQGYLADREILESMLEELPQLAETHQISKQSLTYEPYAIAVRLGDFETRLKVDTALAELFTTPGTMRALLSEQIPARRNDPVLEELFRIQAIPE